MINFWRRWLRSAKEASHETQMKHAVAIIQQLLAVKEEEIQHLRGEIDAMRMIAPLLEDDQGGS